MNETSSSSVSVGMTDKAGSQVFVKTEHERHERGSISHEFQSFWGVKGGKRWLFGSDVASIV